MYIPEDMSREDDDEANQSDADFNQNRSKEIPSQNSHADEEQSINESL